VPFQADKFPHAKTTLARLNIKKIGLNFDNNIINVSATKTTLNTVGIHKRGLFEC